MGAEQHDDFLADTAPAKSRGGRKLVHGRGRQRKVQCEECGCIARMSAGAIATAGLPTCGCGGAFIVPELRDRFATSPDELEAEIRDQAFQTARAEGLSVHDAEERERVAWNDALREIGARHLIVAPRKVERASNAGARPRCAAEHVYCTKWAQTGSAYCLEHDPGAQAADARARDRRVRA